MIATVPENNKKPGVSYAVTEDGLELPVVDVTHPAFDCSYSDEELSVIIEESARGLEALAAMPEEAARPLVADSILLRGLIQSFGTYLSGMMTYLFRLGPNNLGDGYASALDRKIAEGLMPLTLRWRLREESNMLADGLAPALTANSRAPLHLVNIAGGPSADSLNALLLLASRNRELLEDREVFIHVLDIDTDGPAFGRRALAALLSPGGALHGLSIAIDHTTYNWADTEPLVRVLGSIGADAIIAGSSEGGLFSYGTDEQIIANLGAIGERVPAESVFVGSVSCDVRDIDPRLGMVPGLSRLPGVRYLGVEGLRSLASTAGWQVAGSVTSPVDQVVRLDRTA